MRFESSCVAIINLNIFVMAENRKTKRKIYFTTGGRGLKPDIEVKIVSGGKFTKKVRKHKARICGQG